MIWKAPPARGLDRRALVQGGGLVELPSSACPTCAQAAEAIYTGPRYDVWTRDAEANGNLYVDLGCEEWRCIEIAPADLDGDGQCWKVLPEAPLKFVRRPSMRKMTMPAADGDIDLLRPVLNVRDGGDFRLVVGWILASYRARGPYPTWSSTGRRARTNPTCRACSAPPSARPTRRGSCRSAGSFGLGA
jgi:hypothetical protein